MFQGKILTLSYFNLIHFLCTVLTFDLKKAFDDSVCCKITKGNRKKSYFFCGRTTLKISFFVAFIYSSWFSHLSSIFILVDKMIKYFHLLLYNFWQILV